MKFVANFVSVFVLGVFALNAAPADYSNVKGWGEENPMCAEGTSQSPINIVSSSAKPVNNPAHLDVSKIMVASKVEHGSVEFNRGFIQIDETKYMLKGLHFHAPTEHTIDGKQYDLEGHFVHSTASGDLAVIGVMFKVGAENPVIKDILENNLKVNASALIPAGSGYFNYSGSLTTPPCSEPVNWFVMKNVLEVSQEQVDAFKEILGAPKTNRPLQNLNGRVVEFFESFTF